jgi:hypothetical protein
LSNVHILLQTLVLHHRNTIVVAAAVAVAAETKIISDATIGVTIIEMKTNAALKAAYEHL